MTTDPQLHQARRGIVAALLVGLIAGMTACVPNSLGGKMQDPREYPLEGTRPVGVVRTDFYDTVEDTVQLSGVDFLGWDRADPRKIRRVSCAVSSSVMGERFSVSLDGGAVGDPVGVADAVQAEWRSRGWVLGPRFHELEAVIPGVQISVTSQTGIVIVLRPSTIRSTIEASSDCTADPAASVRPSLDSVTVLGTLQCAGASERQVRLQRVHGLLQVILGLVADFAGALRNGLCL